MKKSNIRPKTGQLLLALACFIQVLFCGSSSVASSCPSGMTHYWKLDESSGTVFADFVGGNNASCNGGSDCPAFSSGMIGAALSFNGTVTGINVPADTSFSWSATDSFSIEFWMKTDPASTCAGNEVIVGRKNNTTGLFWVGCANGGGAEFDLYDKNGVGTGVNGTKDLTDGNWHHVVAVRDAGANQIRIYVDGTLENSVPAAFTSDFDFSTPLNIGWLNSDGGFHFAGTIDEVAVYDRPLSDVEIRSHYFLSRGYCDMCASPVRIMPTGDSITQGYNDQITDSNYMASYRQKLYLDLTGAGYNIDFVGGLRAGGLLNPPFDIDNEGHPGWMASCTAVGPGTVAQDIFGWLTANPADVILLHIGTNDISSGCQDVNGVASILDNIDSFSKNITVVLARIINWKTPTSLVTEFNNGVQAIAQTRIANSDKIISVDEENALTYPDDMLGTLHPTQAGYDKMAVPWFNALSTFLPLCVPQAPVITSTPITKAFAGLPYSYNVHSTGNPVPTFSLPLNPSGMLSINPNTGMVAWTPGAVGLYSVTVQAANSVGTAHQDFTIEVVEPPLCPPDIIHYWKLDETSGPSYYDLYGTANASCTDCPIATTGIINGAQRFSLTDKVSAADTGTFNWSATDSFSIEFWMKTDPASTCAGNEVIVGRKNNTTGLFWVGCANGGGAEFDLYDKNGVGTGVNGTKDLTDGNWHHVVAVRDAGANQIRIYVDGTLENSVPAAFTSDFDFSTPLNIGWVNKDGGFHFVGTIDEVALFNRALSDVEIQQHYTNGNSGNGYCYGYYTITPGAVANGSISPSTNQTVIYTGTTSFTITPESGYVIGSVTGCGGTLLGNTYTTGPVTANCTVTATFVIKSYTVTASAGTNGSISPSNPQTVEYNAVTSFTVTPDTGYHVASVTGCGGTLLGSIYTTGPVTANCTVTATFVVNTYPVTASVTVGIGRLYCTPTIVAYGGSFTCSLSPAKGYSLEGLTDNASDVTSQVSGNSYSVSGVTGGHDIEAKFGRLPIEKISGAVSTFYATIQEAYTYALDGDLIESLIWSFNGGLDFNLDLQVTLHGGYDSTFTSQVGFTTISGALTVNRGAVILDGLILN